MNKRTQKRITAIMLAMVMVCSLILVPQEQSKAAETTVALDFATTVQTKTANAKKNVELDFGNAGITNMNLLENAGITELRVKLKITELTAAGDAGAQAFINAADLWRNGSWENLSADSTERTVSLDLTQYYGAGVEIYNFGLQICNVASVTYQIVDACLVKGEGGSTGGGTFIPGGSNIGTIDTSKDCNFAKLLQYSLYFYDGNMCGDGVNDKSLFSKTLYNGWRGNCHVNDKFTYNGKTYSAVGGYHDAGDHVKFGLPMAEAMSTLGLGYMEFKDAFVELNQDQHFRTILDYYCDYVKNCTVTNANGDVEAFCYQVGHGQPDHESWCAPEVEDESRTDRKYTLIATSANPATDIVSETAAALAINYLNFHKESDLTYAKKLFAFATKNSKKNAASDDSGTFYGAGSWEDDYCLAAAMLYKATNDATYKTAYAQNNKNNGNLAKPYGWADVYQAAAMYAPEKNTSEISSMNNWFSSTVSQNKNQYYCADSWGSARYNCNVQLMMLISSKQQGGNAAFEDWAKYQMSIILGNNSLGKNLVVGYNEQSPKQPHHRAASGLNNWNNFHDASVISKYTLYGALVGGPTTSNFSTYVDKMDDDHTSEVTLDYNAGLVGAAAALYLVNKDNKEQGFDNQKVNATFYGGKEFVDKIGNSEDKKSEEPASSEDKKSEEPASSEDKKSEEPTSSEDKKSEEQTSSEDKNSEKDKFVTEIAVTADVKGAKGVAIDKTYKLAPKKKLTLKVTDLQGNLIKEKVTYAISDESVAKINENGVVTAGKKAGTATITIKIEGGVEKTFTLKVTKKAVTKLKVKCAKKTMKKGKTIKAHVVITPKSASKSVVWKSSNTKIATVSAKGKIKALKKGKVKITAIATDGSGKKATVKIKIK